MEKNQKPTQNQSPKKILQAPGKKYTSPKKNFHDAKKFLSPTLNTQQPQKNEGSTYINLTK